MSQKQTKAKNFFSTLRQLFLFQKCYSCYCGQLASPLRAVSRCLMAAPLPAATGSMAVIECNWNSNWIADIGEGRREGLAVLYNSITKLSHHFRTQTNKVKQWGWGGGLPTGTFDASTPRKLFFPLTWDGHPVRKNPPKKPGILCVCVCACARPINTGVSRAQVKFSRGQRGLNANLANGGIMGAEVGVWSQMSKWVCGTVEGGIKGWNGGLSVSVCKVQWLCVDVHNRPGLWCHFWKWSWFPPQCSTSNGSLSSKKIKYYLTKEKYVEKKNAETSTDFKHFLYRS